jgi:XTP/dITP diphosphohydrolase
MKIVLASSNRGKLRELEALLAPEGCELSGQDDLGIEPAVEDGLTFVENALKKARHASERSGLAAIADDSGLVVEALQGDPGIRSARYAGESASDDDNNRKLVARLRGVANRKAHYYCVLVLLENPADPAPLIASGRWRGEIIDAPRGNGGFGYDPHFLLPDRGLTAAELDPDEKNRLSHRALAVRQLRDLLRASRST